MRFLRRMRVMLVAAALLSTAVHLPADDRLIFSVDVDARLQFGCCTTDDVSDHRLVQHRPGTDGVAFVNLGLPAGVDVDAVASTFNDIVLFSIDTAVNLGSGLTLEPGDVARRDGGVTTLAFDASVAGVPAGTDLNAVAHSDDEATPLLVSFDTTVDLSGAGIVDDEDIVATDGATFALFFDGTAAGLPPAVDVDGVHYLPRTDELLISLDGSGIVDGVTFDDEDVLTFDRGAGSWSLRHDLSSVYPDLPRGGDLDAVGVVVDLFEDGFESGDTSAWTTSVP